VAICYGPPSQSGHCLCLDSTCHEKLSFLAHNSECKRKMGKVVCTHTIKAYRGSSGTAPLILNTLPTGWSFN